MTLDPGALGRAVFDGGRPGLVALDIDGTLVDERGMMPDAVHAAVQRVVQAQVPVVLATGRSWHGTKPIFDQLRLPPGLAVSSNGAVVVDYPPVSVRQEVTFDPSDVIARVQELAPEALIAVEDVGLGYRLTGHFPPGELSGNLVLQSPAELSAAPVSRVIIRDPDRADSEFLDLAQRLGLHGVSYFIGWSAWLDIAPEGVDKSTGLAHVLADHGVEPSQVLAIGDGRNDIEMLEWAGRGVAMGQAPDEVKDAANAVTDTFDAHGVVRELDRWFS